MDGGTCLMKKLLLGAVITGVFLTGILNFTTQGKAEFGTGDFKVAENAFFWLNHNVIQFGP